MIKSLLSSLLLIALSGVAVAQSSDATTATRPNIILMIGDGMGLPQITAAMVQADATMHMERFRHTGFIKTHSAVELVTDSAAGATAFSTGTKTYNGAIGVGLDTLALPTILEELAEVEYRTGIISTSSVTHATPASFYAHVPYRKMEEEIALAMTTADIDFVAGGGLDFFTKRKDDQDLVAELRNQGYQVSVDADEAIVAPNADERYVFLHAKEGMPKVEDGRTEFLGDATSAALSYLDQGEEPFFLMIEGSQIDWGGHANNLSYVISETHDFDAAIGQVLDFAEADGNTLVIVTADHETGGLVLAGKKDYREINYKFSTLGHSATLIPVFAFGPGAENFGGIYENTEIYHKAKAVVMDEE